MNERLRKDSPRLFINKNLKKNFKKMGGFASKFDANIWRPGQKKNLQKNAKSSGQKTTFALP
jgi:hypothetical protein